MKLKTSMEVEEILFELHTRFCPLVDTEDNPIKQRHCNMVKNELRKAINSEIEKAREEILIPFDDKPTFGGLINFASNAPEETDISFAKKQAFDYGFRLGWQICYREFLSKLKSLKQK